MPSLDPVFLVKLTFLRRHLLTRYTTTHTKVSNHHHLIRTAGHVTGAMLWANLHLLFWLSLLPFVTGWMGENHFAPLPSSVYGAVLLMAAISYTILQNRIRAHEGRNSRLAAAVGKDVKGKISIVLYLLAIPLAFLNQWLAQTLYILVALIWLVPDRRIESKVS